MQIGTFSGHQQRWWSSSELSVLHRSGKVDQGCPQCPPPLLFIHLSFHSFSTISCSGLYSTGFWGEIMGFSGVVSVSSCIETSRQRRWSQTDPYCSSRCYACRSPVVNNAQSWNVPRYAKTSEQLVIFVFISKDTSFIRKKNVVVLKIFHFLAASYTSGAGSGQSMLWCIT